MVRAWIAGAARGIAIGRVVLLAHTPARAADEPRWALVIGNDA